MKYLPIIISLILVSSCHKEVPLQTSWNGSVNSKKWIRKEIRRQKQLAKSDSGLTFVDYNFIVGRNQISITEYKEFLTSCKKAYGKDSTSHLNIQFSKQSGIVKNITLNQAKVLCNWKTQKFQYEMLKQEGIIKPKGDNPAVSSDNWPGYNSLEEWLQKGTTYIPNEPVNLSGCGPFRKVRMEDQLPVWKYSILDSSDLNKINSKFNADLTKFDSKLVIHRNESNLNSGFRYVFKPKGLIAEWE